MKVLMIHGISQEDYTQKQLLKVWRKLIESKSPGIFDAHDVSMAYYGATLASWTSGAVAMKMGPDDQRFDPRNNAEIEFLVTTLTTIAQSMHVSEESIATATAEASRNEVVPMDTWIGRRLVGLVRAIEKVSPAKGAIALKVIKQAYTYLAAPAAGDAVDALVKPHLSGGKTVVISHSLGTVVALKLLREMTKPDIEVPLFITMGSPLGLEAVRAKLGPPFGKPAVVSQWRNFYDPSDLVALGKKLKDELITDVDDDDTVDNPTSNAHGIVGYLPHANVIAALKSTL